MKDFQEFRKTIDDATLEKWHREIHDALIVKLDEQFRDDPVAWNRSYTQSYAFQTSIRMLDAYHNWLNQ